VKRHTQKPYTRQPYHDKLASYPPAPGQAKLAWLGDSQDVLQRFPKDVRKDVRKDLGYALRQVQLGQMPPDSKPMKTVGPGVYELRDQDERAWYRVFYLKKIADVVYVLHSFEKRTAQTEKKDIDLAKERLKRLLEEQRAKAKPKTHHPRNQGKRFG
jgi:phage-related protein